MSAKRYLLIHEGQRIHLSEGDSLLGRGLGCRVRFNDPAVSREHLRISIGAAGAVAENLSANGTLLNGVRLAEPRPLGDGDELRLGFRRLRVRVLDDEAAVREEEEAARRVRELAALTALQDDHEPTSRATLDVPRREMFTPRTLAAIQTHNCPRCQKVVSFLDDVCAGCGYAWPPGHPSKNTQKIVMETIKQRTERRHPVEVPVIYASESLTIDAIVRDISRGGMFIESELLDPVGTRCEVTALPDGHAALRFSGLVVHVTDDLSRAAVTGVSGLGIRFTSGTADAMRWLESIVGPGDAAALE